MPDGDNAGAEVPLYGARARMAVEIAGSVWRVRDLEAASPDAMAARYAFAWLLDRFPEIVAPRAPNQAERVANHYALLGDQTYYVKWCDFCRRLALFARDT